MYNLRKKLTYILVLIYTLLCVLTPVYAVSGGGGTGSTNALKVVYDQKTPFSQGFAMAVDPVDSQSSTQAFVVGWIFNFTSKADPTLVATVKVDVNLVTDGVAKTYTLPLSHAWTGQSVDIKGGDSIYDVATSSEQKKLDKIFVDGAYVVADACIEKFSYSAAGGYTHLGIFANNETELGDKFCEFSTDFLSNTTKHYFNWMGELAPEPVVLITLPENNITVTQGTVLTFKGFGNNGIHHINGYLNNSKIETQNNPNVTDITQQMKFETTVTLNTIGDFVFQLKGSSNVTDDKPILSETRIVHVTAAPTVLITEPQNNSTVTKGDTVIFKGFGNNGIQYINGYVEGVRIGTVTNPNSDLKVQFKYETTVKLDEVRDYIFQLKGSINSSDSTLIPTETRIVHVTAPPIPDTGTIHITYIDSDTNAVISSSTINNIAYNVVTPVNYVVQQGYSLKGSYSSYSSTKPSTSSMQPNVSSQSTTVSATNKDSYIWFWCAPNKGPVAFIDGPTKVRAGDDFTLSGSRSYCKQAGAKIVNYKWNVDITGVSGETHLGTPGIHTIELTVTDSNGLTASTTHDIEVTPPTPEAKFSLAGKIKENRKITVDARASKTTDNYPFVWSKTTWKIEPDLSTGATWEIGVRLLDGTVKKIDQNTDQSFLNGQYTFDFQARYAGNYKVKLYVENSYSANDTCNGFIVVAKDIVPIGECNVQKENLREYDNPVDSTQRKFGKIPVTDSSSSLDGDIIVKRTWSYRYNSQNNVDANGADIYTDDVTRYKYLGDLSTPFLPQEGERLIVESENDTTVELWWYDVGMTRFRVSAEEGIPDNETIKELLLPSDIRVSIMRGW